MARTRPSAIARAVVELETQLRMNRTEMAHAIGVSRKTIRRWETGRFHPSSRARDALRPVLQRLKPEVAASIARMLGVRLRPAEAPAETIGTQAQEEPADARGARASWPSPPIPLAVPASAPLRHALDAVIYGFADQLDVSPRGLRAAVIEVLRQGKQRGADGEAVMATLRTRPLAADS